MPDAENQTKGYPTKKLIHLTRHAQAEHNVDDDYSIPDARLTEKGRNQSKELNELTKDNVQTTAQLLVCSPMRRPLETMILGYPGLKKRLESEGKPVIILDILQEVEDQPCDTPSYPPKKIQESNEGIFKDLDFSGLDPEYHTKKGIFDPENIQERVKRVRRWLRDRPEDEIVVVAHADIIRHIVYEKNAYVGWENAERRLFTFESADDEEARLIKMDHKSRKAEEEGDKHKGEQKESEERKEKEQKGE